MLENTHNQKKKTKYSEHKNNMSRNKHLNTAHSEFTFDKRKTFRRETLILCRESADNHPHRNTEVSLFRELCIWVPPREKTISMPLLWPGELYSVLANENILTCGKPNRVTWEPSINDLISNDIINDIKRYQKEQILILILLASSWNAQWSKSITEASVDCSGGQAASSSLIQSCQICRMKIEIEHFTEHSFHNVTACYGYLNRLWQLWLYIYIMYIYINIYIYDVTPAGLCL